MKASTLFALGGFAGVSASTIRQPSQDPATEVAQRATSDETTLALGDVSGSGAAGIRLSIPIVQLPRAEEQANEHVRRATSEEAPLALGDVSGNGAAGFRVSVPNLHISSSGKARRATSEETPLSLDNLSGSGAAGVRVSIPNIHTRRATSEETPLALEKLSGFGAAGVRVSMPNVHTRRATSDETPLSLEKLSGSGAAGVRVSIPNVHTRRATSEETPLALGDVSGAGSAGVRVSVPNLNIPSKRATGEGASIGLGELTGPGSAGVRLSFTSVQIPQDQAKDLAKRATNGASFVEEAQMFMVNVTVGTPPQALSLRLSTGQSDTWVIDASRCLAASATSTTCRSYRGGTYNKLNSSSFTRSSSSFTATYDSGPSATGDRFTDVFKIGTGTPGLSIPKAELGLVTSTSAYVGVLGIGHNRSTSATYTSIPDHLVSANLIKSKAYSFWFSDATAKSGNIVFGAIDKAKYWGELKRVPSSTSSGSSVVVLAEAILPGGNNVSRYDLPVRVTINPTDIVSELPSSVASAIWAAANVTSEGYRALVPCSKNSSTDIIKMRLGDVTDGPQWEATIGDLVLPEEIYRMTLTDDGTISSSSRANGTVMCLFGVQNSSYSLSTGTYDYSSSSSSSTYKLAGGLLRRAYLVFDLHNREIALAPTKFGEPSENIEEFATRGATTPGAKLVCSDSSFSATMYSSFCSGSSIGGGGGGSGGGSGGGGSGGVDPWGTQNTGSQGFTGGLAVGVGVLIGLICVALIAFLVWFATKKNWGPFKSKDSDSVLEASMMEKGKGVEYYSGAPPAPMMSGAGHGVPPATMATAPSLAPIQETGPLNGISPVSAIAQPVHHSEHEHVTPPSVEAPRATPPSVAEQPDPHTHAHGTGVPYAHEPAELPVASSSSHPPAPTPGRAI